MGQAKNRGTYEERLKASIAVNGPCEVKKQGRTQEEEDARDDARMSFGTPLYNLVGMFGDIMYKRRRW